MIETHMDNFGGTQLVTVPKDYLARVAETRAQILRLESAMNAMPGRQIQIKTTHTFAPGLYMREIFVPKDTTLTGKIQKTEYLNVISLGDISVMTEAGLRRIKAPAVVRSKPGLKRAGYAHEDTVWITVHSNPTNERDIEKLEEMLFAETFDQAPAAMDTTEETSVITWQGKKPRTREEIYLASPRGFQDVCDAIGVSPDAVKVVSENEADQIPFPETQEWIEIAPSVVHGHGVFTAKSCKMGTCLAYARVGGMRTPAGRFCNHAAAPNAEMVMNETGDVLLIATTDIEAGTEVLTDYYFNFKHSRGVPCRE